MTAPLMFNSFVVEQLPQPRRGPLWSDGRTRMWSPMTSSLIRDRTMRCADGSPIVCSSQPARALIAHSWQRSRLSGLSPSSTFDALRADDYDPSSRLLCAADPVLNTMAAALDGSDYAVMLADRDARIVATRWGCARMRMPQLLGEALPGTIFREATTGTNSIATTYELRHAVAVHGEEHFITQLHGFSCYGHPIIDPHTHRLEGVLSITGLAGGERNPLLAPYVASSAAEIEQRLLAARSPNERALLAALQCELRAARDRPTLAIGRDILLANTAAIELLDAPDHALIRDIAASCTGEATKAMHVTLSKGRGADITCRTLTPSPGAVLTITNVKSPTRMHSRSRPRMPRTESSSAANPARDTRPQFGWRPRADPCGSTTPHATPHSP